MSSASAPEVDDQRIALTRRAGHAIPRLVILILLATAFLFLAPRQVGGSTSYVITEGVSMLPHFRAGGLVVTRTRDTYHVGEVAAYHNQELGAVVMHRIVARVRGRYVFQGDNNDFRDHYRPTQPEIVGQECLYLPHVGGWLLWLRSPAAFGMTLALLTLLAFRGPVNRRRKRHHGS